MKSFILWLSTGEGRLVSAALLYLAIWLLERAPLVRDRLDGRPQAKRAVAVALTILPAVAAGLWGGVPLSDVWQTAITALLAATGANQLAKTPRAYRAAGVVALH